MYQYILGILIGAVLIQGKGAILEQAWSLFKVGARAEQAPQGSGRQRPSFSLPRLRRGVHRPAAAASAPGPVCGVAGMAALPRLRWPGSCPVHGAGVMPRFPRAAARPARHSGMYLQGLFICLQGRQRMALLCVDPLPRSGSAGPVVRLHW